MHDAHADEVLAVLLFGLALLHFFLPLLLHALLLILLDVGAELGDSIRGVRLVLFSCERSEGDILFLRYHLPLYRLLVVRSSAGRTQPVHVVLDIVEAELADLRRQLLAPVTRDGIALV